MSQPEPVVVPPPASVPAASQPPAASSSQDAQAAIAAMAMPAPAEGGARMVSAIPSKLPPEARSHFPVGVVVLGALIVLIGGFWLVRSGQIEQANVTAPTQPTSVQVIPPPEPKVERPTAAPVAEASASSPAPTASASAAAAPKAGGPLAPAAEPVGGATPPETPAAKPAPSASGKASDLATAINAAAGGEKTAGGQEVTIQNGNSASRNSTIPEQPSQGTVAAAMGTVMPGAKACVAGADDVSRATVTFGSSGAVTGVSVSGWAASKPAAGCIKTALKGANVGPFSKSSFSFGVTIRP